MNSYQIAILPGDGIGSEIISESVKALKILSEKYQFKIQFSEALIGGKAIEKTGEPYPKETEEVCKKADAILFGAIGDLKYDHPSVKIRPEQGLLAMRKDLGLFANIRPIKTWPSLYQNSPLKEEILENVDFVFVRELTGGIYFGEPRGRTENGDKAFDTCVYDKNEILRVTKIAFDLAKSRRKKVTLVDKANVLATSRLWRETVSEFAHLYPEIELETQLVDHCAMQLIRNPASFDVILTENLFGDILSDEASMLPGSLGMLPSASVGEKFALFEPVHGSFPQAAGKNIANPMASLLSTALLLRHLQEDEAAADLERAVEFCLENQQITSDLGGTRSTSEVGDAIVSYLKRK